MKATLLLFGVVLLLTASSAARALDRSCLSLLANAAPDGEDRDRLILRAYNDLLDRVGGANLSAAVLREMIKAGKPLVIPEAGEADLGSLKKKLREFEDLLTKKEWVMPEVSELLQAALRKRLQGVVAAGSRRDEAVHSEGNQPDRTVPLATRMPLAISASGRWVLAFSSDSLPGHPDEASLSVVDLHSNLPPKVFPRPPAFRGGAAVFSADGENVIFAKSKAGGLVPVVVPFKNGELLWAKANDPFAGKPGMEQTLYLFPTNDPSVYFGPVTTNSIERYDTATGSRTSSVLPFDLSAGQTVWGYGPIPGTSQYHFQVSENGVFRIKIASYDTQGKFTLVDDTRSVPNYQGPIAASSNGEVLFTTGANQVNRLTAIPLQAGDPRPIRTQSGSLDFPGIVIQTVNRPDQNDLVVCSAGDLDARTMTINIVDLTSYQSRQQFRLPFIFADTPYITPGGRRMIGRDREGNLRVVNIGIRFDQP